MGCYFLLQGMASPPVHNLFGPAWFIIPSSSYLGAPDLQIQTLFIPRSQGAGKSSSDPLYP